MSEGVVIALISAVGLILSGILVELVRSRKAQMRVVKEVNPNGGESMKDVLKRAEEVASRIETYVEKIRDTQVTHGERLARLEATVQNRRATDGR